VSFGRLPTACTELRTISNWCAIPVNSEFNGKHHKRRPENHLAATFPNALLPTLHKNTLLHRVHVGIPKLNLNLARHAPQPLEVVRVYGAPEAEGSTRTAGWRWDLTLPDCAGDDGAYRHLQNMFVHDSTFLRSAPRTSLKHGNVCGPPRGTSSEVLYSGTPLMMPPSSPPRRERLTACL